MTSRDFLTQAEQRSRFFRHGPNFQQELALKKELADLERKSIAEIRAIKAAAKQQPLDEETEAVIKLTPRFVPDRKQPPIKRTEPIFHDELTEKMISREPSFQEPSATLSTYNPLEKSELPPPTQKTRKYPYQKEEVVFVEDMKRPRVTSMGVLPSRQRKRQRQVKHQSQVRVKCRQTGEMAFSTEVEGLAVLMEGKPAVPPLREISLPAPTPTTEVTIEPKYEFMESTEEGTAETPIGKPGAAPAIASAAGTTGPAPFSARSKPPPRPRSITSGSPTPRPPKSPPKTPDKGAKLRRKTVAKSSASRTTSMKSSTTVRSSQQRTPTRAKVIGESDEEDEADSSSEEEELLTLRSKPQSRVGFADDVVIDGELSPPPRRRVTPRVRSGEGEKIKPGSADSEASQKSMKELLAEAEALAAPGADPLYKARRGSGRSKSTEEEKKSDTPPAKAERSVDEIIATLRATSKDGRAAPVKTEADRKIQEIMERVMTRASAVLSELGVETTLTKPVQEEEEPTQEVEERESEEEDEEESEGEMEELEEGEEEKKLVPTIEVAEPTPMAGADARSPLPPPPPFVSTEVSTAAPSVTEVISPELQLGVEEPAVVEISPAELAQAWKDLTAPAEVTHEDVVNMEGLPLELSEKWSVLDVRPSQVTVPPRPVLPLTQSVSFSALRAPQEDTAPKEVQPRVRDSSHTIHHFCTSVPAAVLPPHLRNISRFHHTWSKFFQPEYYSDETLSETSEDSGVAPSVTTTVREADNTYRIEAAAQRVMDKLQPSHQPLDLEGWKALAQEMVEGPNLSIDGTKMDIKEDISRLYWTPAPPKLDLPPSYIRSRVCPDYVPVETAGTISPEKSSLMEFSEEESEEEEEEEEEEDPEEREQRERLLRHKHPSATDLTKLARLQLEWDLRGGQPSPERTEESLAPTPASGLTTKTRDEEVSEASFTSEMFYMKTRELDDDEIFTPAVVRRRRAQSAPQLFEEGEEVFSVPADFDTSIRELKYQAQKISELKASRGQAPAKGAGEEAADPAAIAATTVTSPGKEPAQEKGLIIKPPKPTPAELAREAGMKYIIYPKKKKKKPAKKTIGLEKALEIQEELLTTHHRLQRSASLPKLDLPVERMLRVPPHVRTGTRGSVGNIPTFLQYSSDRNMPGDADVREWVRDIWNEWFNEVFPSSEDGWSEMSSVVSELDTERKPTTAPVITADAIESIEPIGESEEDRALVEALQDEARQLTERIEKEGETPFDLCRRGAIHRKLGLLKKAEYDLSKAILLEPKLLDAYWHRHLLHLVQEKPAAAIEDLNFILKHNKKHVGAYRSRAEVYRKQDDYTSAIVNYTQAIKLQPDDHEAYYYRAEMYEKKGDMLLALEDFAQATRLMPSRTEAVMKHGLYYFNNGNWIGAVNDFTALLQQEPNNAVARTYRGRAYAQQGHYSSAVEDLSAAIHLDPNNAIAFYHRGCLLRKVHPKKSLQDLSVSILLDDSEDNVKAILHRGILYTDMERWTDAISDFEHALKLDRNLACAHVNLGLIFLHQLENYFKAIGRFTQAIKTDPTYIRAYICRSEAYHKIHKRKQALLDITRAIHLRPDVQHYYMRRGQLLLQMKNLELASFCVQHASELKDGLGASSTQQAVVQSFLKQHDKAVETMAQACRVKPSPQMYTLLGKTQMKAKQFEDAVGTYKRAIQLLTPWQAKQPMPWYQGQYPAENTHPLLSVQHQEAAEVYYYLGLCHLELFQYMDALEAFNNALKVNPSYAEAYYQRGLTRLRLKQSKGIQDFNRALALDPYIFQAFLSRAAYYGMKGRYTKAIMNCNEAIKLQPNSVRAYLYRGALKYYVKTYKLAVKDLSKAASIDRTCSLAYFNRAVCYHEMKDFEKALQDYGIVLLLEEKNLKVLINRGLLYFEQKDYRNALQDFMAAAQVDVKDPKLCHTVGLCRHKLDKLEDAVDSFSQAIQVDPFFIDAYIGRGNAYMDYGHEEGILMARKDYEHALRLDPTNVTARVNLAYNLQVFGKFMQAWRQFTAAVDMSPRFKPALEGRAVVNLQMSNTYAAWVDINDAVKIGPSAELYTNRGVINQFMDDYTNAIKDYKSALQLDPTFSLAYFNAANLYFHMKQFTQAKDFYDKAVQCNSKDESAHLNRAITKVMLKDTKGALEDFKMAAQLSPYSAHVYFNRGNLYAGLKQYDKAEKDYTKALSLQPDDALVYKRRADVRGKLSRTQDAIQDYRRAVEIQARMQRMNVH
ncbi:uncharacterized protein LOC144917111 isoform X2 [Branchiostoma floridae x Branchiostoma belcheri]